MAFCDFQDDDGDAFHMDEEQLERQRGSWERFDVLLDEYYERVPRVAFARCDGSGVQEEYYIDVGQTNVIPCPGCKNCDPANFPEIEFDLVERRVPLSQQRKQLRIASKNANAVKESVESGEVALACRLSSPHAVPFGKSGSASRGAGASKTGNTSNGFGSSLALSAERGEV